MSDVLSRYADRIQAIPGITLKESGDQWQIEATTQTDDPEVQIKEIRAIQKQLRQIRQDLNQETKQIRSQYRSAIDAATYTPGVGGTLLGSKYRGSARRAEAAQKRSLRDRRDRAVAPYSSVKRILDQALALLDTAKEECEAQKSRHLAEQLDEARSSQERFESLVSLHKRVLAPRNWDAIATALPPIKPTRSDRGESSAQFALDTYKPSRWKKLRHKDEAERSILERALTKAKEENDNKYQDDLAVYRRRYCSASDGIGISPRSD